MSPNATPRRSTLILVLLAGITASSTAAIFVRFAQSEGAPSIVIAAARLSIASLILAPFAIRNYRKDLRSVNRSEWILAVFSGFFLALHFATWISSLAYTTVASSVVLVTTTPLWVALLSPLVLRERIKVGTIIGLIMALVGGLIIGLNDTCRFEANLISCPDLKSLFSGNAIWGDILALAGAWMAAGYLLIGRKLRASLPLIPYIFLVYGIAAVVLLIIMLFMGDPSNTYPPLVFLWFFLLALIPQLLGHTSFNWALKYVPASFVSVILLGEPIGSSILALIIFREQPGVVKLGGILFILVGIGLAARETESRPGK